MILVWNGNGSKVLDLMLFILMWFLSGFVIIRLSGEGLGISWKLKWVNFFIDIFI